MEKRNSGSFYEVFRNDILDLRLRPGMVFSIKDVCELYQTGRSPVREALIRLEQEGLIAFLPQRGTMVSRIDRKRANDERFLRFSLEDHVMEECMAFMTPETASRLEHCIQMQKECYEKEAVREFLEWDDAFHAVFYDTAGRTFCRRITEAQAGHYHRIRLLSATDRGINQEIIREHEQMAEALARGDEAGVRKLLGVHLQKADVQEEELARRFPDLFEGTEAEEGRQLSPGLQSDFLTNIQKYKI